VARKPIVAGAEPLYEALALARAAASEDPEWGYVAERIDETTSLYEDLLAMAYAVGWPLPRDAVEEAARVRDAARARDQALTARHTSRLWEALREEVLRARALAHYVYTARVAAALAALLAAAAGIAWAGTWLSLAVAAGLFGVAAVALLTYRLRVCDFFLAAAAAASVALAVVNPEAAVPALASALVSAASAPLAPYLSRRAPWRW